MDNLTDEDPDENVDQVFNRDLFVKSKMLKSSIAKSDSSLKTRDFFELEINLEYDVVTKDGAPNIRGGSPTKMIKKDLFSGMIKLPKAFAKNFINNQMFGEIKFDNKKFTPGDKGKLEDGKVG